MIERRAAIGVVGGAILAGLVAGTAGTAVSEGLAVTVGLAIALPLVLPAASGQTVPIDAYLQGRSRVRLVTDAGLVIAAGLLLGVAGVLVTRSYANGSVLVAVGAGLTFLGGSMTYHWLAGALPVGAITDTVQG